MTRRHDVRRVNTRLSYRADEVAELMKVTKITVYHWIAEGLSTIDRTRPYLIHGSSLAQFLTSRNKLREPMRAGQIYCVACKRACVPFGAHVEWIDRSPTNGDIVGICPRCRREVFRRVRRDRLHIDLGDLILSNKDAVTTMMPAGGHPHSAALEE